jgi:hypothetical protein
MSHIKSDIYHSYAAAIEAAMEAAVDGWKIDPINPPSMVGFNYQLVLVHDGVPPVRRSRAEILADARAAKARKQEGK